MKTCQFVILTLLLVGTMSIGSQVAAQAQAASDADTSGVQILNPNLATSDELNAVLDNEELSAALIENRPFLSLTDLHTAFAEILGEGAEDALRKVAVRINLNSASREEILLIPGVGNRMAHEFEEYRPYVAMAQFHREIGKYVDDDELERLAAYVFVPVDLNSASDDEILAIPGVGRRMLHEFKEYRPYVNMAQFRREIGKYVDDEELARLERFVTL